MRSFDLHEIARFCINGVVATAIHFSTLTFLLHGMEFEYAGIANGGASFVGITFSFLGSRYFVYTPTDNPIKKEMLRFVSLYASIAVFHAATLFIWTDLLEYDYRIGFLVATVLQVSLSYLGNKKLVFA